MSDSIVLTLPEDISEYIRTLAQTSAQSIEQVLVEKLRVIMDTPSAELVALNALSTDALRVIFLEEMRDELRLRKNYLETKKSQASLTASEAAELQSLVEREKQLLLRKATAENILRERGYFQIPHLTLHLTEIETFCQTHQIKRISLFGSVIRDDFTPESDIDVLVEFQPSAKVSLMTFAQMQNELTAILGRKVDLLTPEALSQHFRDNILATAQVIYEQQ
jgi:uncharacterized protein